MAAALWFPRIEYHGEGGTVTTLIIPAIHLMEWKAVLSRNAFLLEIPHLYAVVASHYRPRSHHTSRYYHNCSLTKRDMRRAVGAQRKLSSSSVRTQAHRSTHYRSIFSGLK